MSDCTPSRARHTKGHPMTATELPKCSISYPTCGACYGETSHDGDSFYCDDCDLDYGSGDDGEEAAFRDEECAPCGKPCADKFHGEEYDTQYKYTCHPCSLPETHAGDCWTSCKLERITP